MVQSQQAQDAKRRWFVRRQESAIPSSDEPVAGVSSFAYQGTNAHIIAALTGQQQPAIMAPRSRNWRNQRFWYQVGP